MLPDGLRIFTGFPKHPGLKKINRIAKFQSKIED